MIPGGASYAAFQAHITALATNGVAGWASGVAAGSFRTTAAAATGTMFNTTWGNRVYTGDTIARRVQHGLPSEAVFNDQVANGRMMFVRFSDGGDLFAAASINRNGYTSSAYDDGLGYPSVWMEEIIYWDGTSAWRITPRTAGSPTPYVF